MEKVSIVVDGKTYEYEKGTTFKKPGMPAVPLKSQPAALGSD